MQSAASLVSLGSRRADEVEDYVFLPSGIAGETLRAYGDGQAPDSRDKAAAILDESKKKSRRRMDYWLKALSPEVILDSGLLWSVLGESTEGLYVGRKAGFNRMQWMIAAAAGGTDCDSSALMGFVTASAEWIAADILANRFRQAQFEVSRGVDTNPWFESARRYMHVAVHMRWASEVICMSVAHEVADQSDKYAELSFVTPNAVSEIFKWVEAKGRSRDADVSDRPAVPIPELSDDALALLDALSLSPGSLKGLSSDALMSDLRNEEYPFVRFTSGVAPVSDREASCRLELALFSLARRLLKDDKDRSDLFEATVRRSLHLTAPSDMVVGDGEAACPIPDSKNPGQTDFVLRGATSTYIGECKSMVASPKTTSVINSFQTDVGKATDQVKVRMEALDAGAIITVDGQPWESPRGSIYGLAVPLHDYGGAVWHHDCLPLVGGLSAELGVIPLHQLVMVMRAMKSEEDLAAYLNFRSALIGMGYESFDELDLLVPFLFPAEHEAQQPWQGREPDFVPPSLHLRIEHWARLCDPAPKSADAWQRRLKDIVRIEDHTLPLVPAQAS